MSGARKGKRSMGAILSKRQITPVKQSLEGKAQLVNRWLEARKEGQREGLR